MLKTEMGILEEIVFLRERKGYCIKVPLEV